METMCFNTMCLKDKQESNPRYFKKKIKLANFITFIFKKQKRDPRVIIYIRVIAKSSITKHDDRVTYLCERIGSETIVQQSITLTSYYFYPFQIQKINSNPNLLFPHVYQHLHLTI